jgi:hypothetical protein
VRTAATLGDLSVRTVRGLNHCSNDVEGASFLVPLDHFLDLRARLNSGASLSPELRRWLLDAVEAFVSGERLEEALGLKPRAGQRSLRTTLAVRCRDELLRQVAKHFDGSVSAKADAVHRAWSRYCTSTWRFDRAADGCPYADGMLQPRPLAAGSIRNILHMNTPLFACSEAGEVGDGGGTCSDRISQEPSMCCGALPAAKQPVND